MSFVRTALDEINDDLDRKLRYNALSHRASKLEGDEFSKFLKEIEDDEKPSRAIEVDHEAQMKQFLQG